MAATTGVRPFAPQEQSSTKTTVGPKGDRQHESSTSVVMPTPPRLGTGGRPYNNSGTRGTNGGPHGSKHHPRHDFASNDPNFDPFPQQYRPTQQQAHLNQRRQTAGHGVSHSPTYHHRSPHPAAHNNTFVTMGMPIMPSSQYDYSSSLNMHHGISSQRPPKRPPIHPRGGDGNPQNGSGSRQERPSRTPPFYTKTGRQGGSGGRNHAAKITTGGWAQNSGHANAPALPYASQWGYHTNSSVPIPVPPPSTTGTVQDTVVLQANNQQEKEIGLEDDDQDDVEVVMTRYGGCSTQQISGPTSAGAPKDQGHERDHLREQLEWYFSPRNLSVDTYLVSQMNSERYVPISVIAGFKMVKALTSDINEVVAAFRRSSVVTVDETGTLAKPISVDRPRTTLILRDLLEDTQEEEIANLFKEGNCPAKTITKEVGNTWFVEFDTAENALAMLNFTRGQTLRGYPIAGRLKSNTVLTGGEYRAIQSTSSVQGPGASYSATASMGQGWSASRPDLSASASFRRFPLEESTLTSEPWNNTASQERPSEANYHYGASGQVYHQTHIPGPEAHFPTPNPSVTSQMNSMATYSYYNDLAWTHTNPYLGVPHPTGAVSYGVYPAFGYMHPVHYGMVPGGIGTRSSNSGSNSSETDHRQRTTGRKKYDYSTSKSNVSRRNDRNGPNDVVSNSTVSGGSPPTTIPLAMTTSPYPGTPNQKNVAEEAKGINQDQEDTNHSMVVAVPRSPSLLVNSGGTNVISSALEVAESGESPLDGGDRRKKRVGKRTTGSRPQRDTRKAKPAEESQRKEREVPTNSSHIDHGVDSKESINTSSGNDGVGKLQSKLSNVSLQDRPSGYEPSVKGKRRGNTQHDATTKSSASRAPPLLKGDNFPPLPTASSTSPAPVETHNPSEIVDTPLSQEEKSMAAQSLSSGPWGTLKINGTTATTVAVDRNQNSSTSSSSNGGSMTNSHQAYTSSSNESTHSGSSTRDTSPIPTSASRLLTVHQNYSLPSGPGNNVASQKQGSDQLGERHVQREGGILGGMVASVSQSIPVMNTESSKTSTAAAPGTKQMTSNGEYDRAMQSGKTSGATSVSSGLSYASALKVQQ